MQRCARDLPMRLSTVRAAPMVPVDPIKIEIYDADAWIKVVPEQPYLIDVDSGE